jgi:hypothetical protein
MISFRQLCRFARRRDKMMNGIQSILKAVCTCVAIPLLVSGAVGSGPGTMQGVRSPDDVPAGMMASDWASIRAAYDAQRHAPFAVEGGYQARNPAQQWLTRFDPRGFSTRPDAGGWEWGLELRSYGFAGEERAVAGEPKIETAGQRVTYTHDAVLEEWFVNDQRGLEHGFTVKERPPRTVAAASTSLSFLLGVRGGLQPELSPDRLGVRFVDAQARAVINYSGLKVWDADGKPLPSRFEPAEEGIRLTVDERGARYPVTIDPIAQQAYLKASNPDAGDLFGTSVAISGDTVVVGAPREDSSARLINGPQGNNDRTDSGAAYVFVRNGSGWTQQAYLKASNADQDDEFGFAVAISGDTVVVGAYGEDSNATGINGSGSNNGAEFAGAAYVFVRDGVSWTQQAYLKASNTDAGDGFGWSVAMSGDTVVVGAFAEASAAAGVNGDQTNNSAPFAGAAYVFVRSGTAWRQEAYLKAANPSPGAGFGLAVGISGETAIVGAAQEGSGAMINAGAAYVFARDGTAWSQQAYLKAANAQAEDRFGISVAISGDTVVVGAQGEDSSARGVGGNQADNNAEDAGAAYVFKRMGSQWQVEAYLKAFNTDMGDEFGTSVAISGDLVVVGARYEDSKATGINGDQTDNSVTDSGAAYLFVRNGAIWTHQAYLKASNTGIEDRFSRSVAISGDTVVVGAASEDSGASGVNGNQADNTTTNAGAVYVFNDAGERAQRGPDFLVTSLAGDNDGLCGVDDCTLADAVHAANENSDASIISFAPGLSGTITNSRAAGMPLRSEITIAGPGARLLTVSGGNTARLFNVNTSGFVSLRRLTLAQGRAGGATFPGNCGGAIFAAGGVVGLSDCAIVGNTSAVHGGAIYNSGIDGFATLFASECTFSKNVASASGGAVFNAGYNGQATVSLLNATLDGNEAKQIGGAIYNDGTVNGKAHVSLKNCTLHGNTAAAQAGGIYNDAFNPDSTGTASVTLANTILNRGASGANLVNERGTMVSEGHNLSSDAAGGLAGSAPAGFLNATNDRRNTDPRLAPLANNGGPTDTIALLSDSPAIDAANDSTAPSTDQRGFKRVGVSDIGAFEFGGTEPTATPTPPPPTPTPTPTPVPKLGNIATRVRVETGENVLIGGMIITGSQPKRLILRAVGPSLDVTGALTNPQLEIYRGDELIAGERQLARGFE